MNFGSLMYAAQSNTSQKSNEIRCYKTSFSPPKKDVRDKSMLSANVQKFLAKQEEEKRRKEVAAKKKRDELLSLRSLDKMSVKRVSTMLKRTKSANKSVMEDAIDDTNTVVTRAGPSQPDEDDYGYVSQEASSFYNKLMDKYSTMPAEDDIFAKPKKATVKDLNAAKERVRAALNRVEEEEMMPRKRKRKHKDDKVEEDGFVDDNIVYEEVEKEEPKPKKVKHAAPPPMDFSQLLKIAEQKQYEPVVIEKKVEFEDDKPMTKKQRQEYLREKEAREQRERREQEYMMRTQNKSSRPPSKPSSDRSPNNSSQFAQKIRKDGAENHHSTERTGRSSSNESSAPRIPKINKSNDENRYSTERTSKSSSYESSEPRIPKINKSNDENRHSTERMSKSSSYESSAPRIAKINKLNDENHHSTERMSKSSSYESSAPRIPKINKPNEAPSRPTKPTLQNIKIPKLSDREKLQSNKVSSPSHSSKIVPPSVAEEMLKKPGNVWSKPCNLSPSSSPVSKFSSNRVSSSSKDVRSRDTTDRQPISHQNLDRRKEVIQDKQNVKRINGQQELDRRKEIMREEMAKRKELMRNNRVSSDQNRVNGVERKRDDVVSNRGSGVESQKKLNGVSKTSGSAKGSGERSNGVIQQKSVSSSQSKKPTTGGGSKVFVDLFGKDFPNEGDNDKKSRISSPGDVRSQQANKQQVSSKSISSMDRNERLSSKPVPAKNVPVNKPKPQLSQSTNRPVRPEERRPVVNRSSLPSNGKAVRPGDVKSRPQLQSSKPSGDIKPRQFPPADVRPRQFPPPDVRRKRPPPPPMNRRRVIDDDDDEEYDSEMDDFIVDSDQEEDIDVSQCISEIFRYDKNKYKNIDDYDEEAMESGFLCIEKEEKESARIGREEDEEELRKEKEEKKLAKERKLKRLQAIKKPRRF